MDNTTLLILIIVILLLGGGWYGRGRWYWVRFSHASLSGTAKV